MAELELSPKLVRGTIIQSLKAKRQNMSPPRFGYHGTSSELLSSILKKGLLRSKTKRGNPAVFLVRSPELAEDFGDIILKVDLRGLTGQAARSEILIYEDIAPKRVMVIKDNG